MKCPDVDCEGRHVTQGTQPLWSICDRCGKRLDWSDAYPTQLMPVGAARAEVKPKCPSCGKLRVTGATRSEDNGMWLCHHCGRWVLDEPEPATPDQPDRASQTIALVRAMLGSRIERMELELHELRTWYDLADDI